MASMLYSHLPQIIGVVGAGQMGSGIAQVCATKGFQVILADQSQDFIERGLSHVKKSLDKFVRKEALTNADATASFERITTSTSLEAMKDVDFIIEAVPENEELKKGIFSQLDQVGMHFMNPVPIMQLVELIKGMHTSQQTFMVAKGLAEHLGKQVCVSQDRPGFIVNRILMPLINEAFFTLMEGVGTPEDIDRGMKLGTNMPMGPLRLADFIGLDTCLSIMRVLHHGLGESKYRPCPLLVQYVDAGLLGNKSGRGVYDHHDAPVEKKP